MQQPRKTASESTHSTPAFDTDDTTHTACTAESTTDLLTVEGLRVQFPSPDEPVRAVDGVSFGIADGEIVGLVGESGCGKSVTARSIIGLDPPEAAVRGSIELDGTDVTAASERQLRRLRGDTVSMVFQNSMETLNPVLDIGEQIAESTKVHDHPDSQRLLDYLHAPLFSSRADWHERREHAADLLDQVGIASPEERVDDYPHELSGGQIQRVAIALALASDPDLLIADEPTTAVDATTQAQLLDRFRHLNDTRGMALLLITHDLSVVAELCDRVVVMYAGQVVETGPAGRVLRDPSHPYTRALLDCLPQRVDRNERLPTIEGAVPDPTDDRSGCPFAPRCERATDDCRHGDVPTIDLGDGRGTATCYDVDDSRPAAPYNRPGITVTAASDESDPTREPTPAAETPAAETPSSESTARSSTREKTRPESTADGDREPLVELEGVTKQYATANGLIDRLFGATATRRAVADVDLEIRAGETLGLVGETGCGKTTLAELVTGLETPTAGEIRFGGDPVGGVESRSAETLADVGVVFQNPRSSLNPRLTVEQLVAEPLRSRGWSTDRRRERVRTVLDRVGLSEHRARSYPHELSGGQVQRVAIARAITPDPTLVVLDEPVSALDVSIQARILNLLSKLQAEFGLTYLLISHDLAVVEHVVDRVAVMSRGELVEIGPVDRGFDQPTHPYTKTLLASIPSLSPEETAGVRPSASDGVSSSLDRPTR
ncbi:dipeptide ABC transporter ATP-binding protein [Natrialba taiwanensis]|uniref:Nickel import system ATP-binding protein NikD n=1 Tax=Natrialba taiwanensis DSM 12281 TaxID=1230458 RepID=L9ZPF3_9EURY|nr:ABC transporter ATP-binding protein [Natrialba taiwanensis]ELY87946.1 oligopeptide/dipeptide ABC transporter, ATPase subunit [Natrialba taiwanensis DSM 12281]